MTDGDDIDIQGRVGRAGARGQSDRADVAVEDVVRDAQCDRLIVAVARKPEVPQAQPGGEHDDRNYGCRSKLSRGDRIQRR